MILTTGDPGSIGSHTARAKHRQHSQRESRAIMNTTVTDDQIRQLAETAKPYSLALLRWGPERHMDGAEATELEHQRRMVSLRADGVIAILCPVASETLAGVAIMNVPPEEAKEIMDGDPCVRARMILCDVHSCHGFPGDALPA
jgi:hypothetical protein